MSSKSLLAVFALLAACADDPQVVELTGRATETIMLGPGKLDAAPEGDAVYRWELVQAPDTSVATVAQGQPIAPFVPDLRGVYVIERWMKFGLADRLTHQFVLQAAGSAPIAVLEAEPSVTISTAVVLDATQSNSLEALPLTYQWRLAERPRDSTATIEAPQNVTTAFVPDKGGDYVVELAVFDGELWSEHVGFVINAN